MMLAHQFSARGYLVFLAALLLTIFLLTAHRLHTLPPGIIPYFDDATFATTEPSTDKQQIRPQPTTAETTVTGLGEASNSQPEGSADFCGKDWDFLRRKDLGLTDNIIYTRRCIRPAFGDVDRNVVANISSPLVGGTTTINLKSSDCSALTPPPCEPLTLQVPSPYPDHRGRYCHLMFGVASTIERLWASLPEFAHWLSGTGAHLVLVVQDANEVPGGADLAALTAAFQGRGISVTVKPPSIKTAIRRADTPDGASLPSPAPVEQIHFLLINDMLEIATHETQWLGVLDDDTFFPALHPLNQMLATYDHRLPHWLGALSDSWEAVKNWGYMAFGGAGTLLSMPLARELSPHLESCLRETSIRTGDGMLKECMYLRSATRLTLVDGLHQHDIRGDVSGFFESGRKVLSLHHWKSWYRAPVLAMATVTSVCGDCFLQRWRFGGNTLFVNGYSISVYRDGLDGIDLGRMEGTFDSAGPDYAFMYGALRPRLGNEEKKSYRLVATDGPEGKGDDFRQVYVHRAPRGENAAGAMDEVVELIWEV
ncbi:hypothetical protein VTJ49DRAFT_1553 [Mycothermus thermophilus]|uniref:Glycosyltransferase family 31 protein n=1 Tax=Humicola insolens TaxID=85995 RepID=A0ABR3VNH1_HUMIN